MRTGNPLKPAKRSKHHDFLHSKENPASNWSTIHRNLDLDTAKDILSDIGANYDADSDRSDDSSLSEDGTFLSAYEGGDLHEFRILEA